VTVPDVRVTSVRRTVTVAGALIVGQASLCVVIGFVTFGGRDDATPGAHAAAPQIAVPPAISPSPNPSPSRSAAGEKLAAVRSTTPRPTSPAPTTDRERSSPAGSTAPASTPAAPVSSTTSPPDLGLVPSSSSAPAPGDTPEPAVVNARCDTEGATGRTGTGKAVRCERTRDGDLRWRLV